MARKKAEPLNACPQCGNESTRILRGPFGKRAAKMICADPHCGAFIRWSTKDELAAQQIPVETEFTIIIDTAEKEPYTFEGLTTNSDDGRVPIIPKIMRHSLPVGDYGLLDHQNITIERKSKEDLFASMAKHENFDERLALMSAHYLVSYVVVEAEESDIRDNQPPYSNFLPKSLFRSVMAWTNRYPNVHWWFSMDREAAEATVFRLLERHYNDNKYATLNIVDASIKAFQEGVSARLGGNPVDDCPYEPATPHAGHWEQGWRYCDMNIIQINNPVKDIRICNGKCIRYSDKRAVTKK